jgi:hypothetical protein
MNHVRLWLDHDFDIGMIYDDVIKDTCSGMWFLVFGYWISDKLFYGVINNLIPPEPPQLQDCPTDHWHCFQRSFNIYHPVSGLSRKPHNVQAMTLFYVQDQMMMFSTCSSGNPPSWSVINTAIQLP